MYAITIDAYTGNVYCGDPTGYWGNDSGDRLFVCNSEKENCVVVAASPLVAYPIGIAVNSA